MKRTTILLLMISFSLSSFSQNETVIKDKNYYLKKSKNQKVGAFILLGVSAVSFAIVAPGNVDFDAILPLAILGTASGVGSITLFIASGRNKRKAATVYLQMQRGPMVLRPISYPALTVGLRL